MSHADAIAVAQSLRDFISRIDAITRYVAERSSPHNEEVRHVQGMYAALKEDLRSAEKQGESQIERDYLQPAVGNAISELAKRTDSHPKHWYFELAGARLCLSSLLEQLESQYPELP